MAILPRNAAGEVIQRQLVDSCQRRRAAEPEDMELMKSL
jgi:hypothetical protein